ncbi:hypothetical protein [Companilactobacillus kedongensis]|uniref:hypothetical protein n=1 Tax=Companilactobacillus kedongensis TaxID=2486004 RepID=UPI000F77EDC4|nr:hypothetical protein [Companilactobacillus kedongensis]
MRQYNKAFKFTLLSTFSVIAFVFLTLQYQKVNADYDNPQEVTISKNQLIKAKNVEFKVLNTSIREKNIDVTLWIKQTGPGYYGMHKSYFFIENMWIADQHHTYSNHSNMVVKDQNDQALNMNKFKMGQSTIANVHFDKPKENGNDKFYFLVPNKKHMTKYNLSVN